MSSIIYTSKKEDTSLVQGSIVILGTMATLDQLATRIRRILTNALPSSAEVKVVPRPHEVGPAFDVTVRTGATKHRFLAGWAGEGWPGDVKKLMLLVPKLEIVVASKLSISAKALLEEQGIGWIGEAGETNINQSSGLIIVRDLAPVRSRQPEVSGRWSRSMLAVAEAALSGITPTVENIEKTTGLSRNATATGLARLEKLGLLERLQASRGPRSGRRIVDPDALLDSYATAAAEQRSKKQTLLVHRLWNVDPMRTLRKEIAPALSDSKHSWAVTGVAASMLIAPYLTDVTTLDLYVDAELMSNPERLASSFGARIVERGHVIEVRETPTVISAKGPVVDDIHVALPVRVYADLLSAGGRRAEAAQHLREGLDTGAIA